MVADSGSTPGAAGRPFVYYGAIGAVVAAFAAVAYVDFGHLFLLNEYRQWSEGSVFFNPLVLFSPSTIFNASAFSVAFSRAFTFEVVAAFGGVCGSNASCHDVFHIALLCISALLAGFVLLRLFPKRPVLFVAGAVLFMVSAQPVFDALSWQATLLDKLALLFTALGTYAIASLDVRRAGVRYALGTNIVFLLLTIAAYNSKEASFPLVPSLVLLLTVRFAAPVFAWRAVAAALGKSLSWLAAPALYAGFHVAVVYYNRTYVLPGEGQRVTGGDAAFNFYQYVVDLFNLQPFAYFFHLYPYVPQLVLVRVAFIVLALLAALCWLIAKIASRTTTAVWFWALISFLMAIVIPLRTAVVAPFYLLVPLFYLTLLVCAAAVAFWEAARTIGSRAAVQGAFALALVLHVWGLAWPYPSYMHVVQMSDNFTAALPALRERIAATDPRSIVFRWPKSEPLAYMFLGSPGNRGLALYLAPRTPAAALTAIDAKIADAPYDDGDTSFAPSKPGELTIVLGPSLKLERTAVFSPRTTK